jgi:hypothetical protein
VTNTNTAVNGTQTATATSNAVLVTVSAIVNAATPTITASLLSPTTNVGTAVTALDATATASDSGTITYQWYSNGSATTTGGTAITTDGTSATYVPSVVTAGTYYYYCVVTNSKAVAGTTTATATSNVSTVTVTDIANTDANLSAIAISDGTLSPSFASGTESYTASVANGTSSITVTPTVTTSGATVTVNGTTVATGTPSSAISLTEGSNKITIIVTSLDTTVTKTYTIVVTRAAAPSEGSSYSGSGTSASSAIPISQTSSVESAISSTSGSKAVTTTMTGTTTAAAGIFSTLAENTDKILTIKAADYAWIVKGSDVTNPTASSNYDLGASFKWAAKNEITTAPTGASLSDLVVDVNLNSSTLPGQMTLQFSTMNVSTKYAGKTLYYYYNDTSSVIKAFSVSSTIENLVYYGTVTVASDGTVKLPLDKGSEYLLTEKRILTDISSSWAYDSIIKMVSKDIVSGTPEGLYQPEKDVTRSEFAKMVAVAFGYTSTKDTSKFSDVSSSDWYYEYVNALTDNGIMLGLSESNFGANDNLTREQMATIIYRVIQNKNYSISGTSSSTFKDVGNISSYAADSVKALSNAEIIKGFTDGKFMPQGTATKAQIAAILDRLLLSKN